MDRETYLRVITEHMKSSYLISDDKIAIILPNFLTTLKGHLNNLEEKLSRGEPTELGAAAHTIKGALLNLGLFELADTAYVIEQKGKLLDTNTDYAALVDHLKQQIAVITTR